MNGETPSLLLTDLGDKNPGASVTNAIEKIWETLLARGYLTAATHVIEHYEAEGADPPAFTEVASWDKSPSWREITIQEAAETLGCDEAELAQPTLSDHRLLREVEALRVLINPFADMADLDPPDVLFRRDQIAQSMVSRERLKALVESSATERVLQDLIRSDLSVIAELYAHPPEEYIVFSEFPVDTGRVDSVLFSGRSRMDVTMVEVKGAEFPSVTRGSYENFSAKMNEAAQQIRRRQGYINREYSTFRKFVHKVRADVEKRKQRYGSFVGPYSSLEVDPNKDILVRYVVVAGRTTDDLVESELRHEFETSFNPSVRIETWDSLLNKLRRR